jgi:hypothetical protein
MTHSSSLQLAGGDDTMYVLDHAARAKETFCQRTESFNLVYFCKPGVNVKITILRQF